MKKIIFAVTLFLFVAATAGAQTFQGPCANPPGGNCGILFASTSRALQIGTSTIWSAMPQLIFQTQTGANQHIDFLPNGNVGIATTTPAEKLTVVGNIFATGNIQGTALIGTLSGSLSAANVSSNVFGSLQGNGDYAFPAYLGISTASKTGLPQPLSVYGNAYFQNNVGIGSSVNPTGRLDITGSSGVFRIDTTGAYADFTFNGANYIRATGASGSLSVQAGGTLSLTAGGLAGAPDIFITAAGDVGIGTSTPMAAGKLIVDGQVKVKGLDMLGGTSIAMNGGNITGANKITVTTLDPLYRIEGTNYATYAPSVAGGVYEEFLGRAITRGGTGDAAEFIIDFDTVAPGSDLWVWKHAVDFSKETITVTVTPYGSFVNVYYLVEGNKIIIRTNKPTEFSYRLSGKRFDWRQWPTRPTDQGELPSLIVP